MFKKISAIILAAIFIIGLTVNPVSVIAQEVDGLTMLQPGDPETSEILFEGENIGDLAKVYENHLMLPLRILCEKTGFNISWTQDEKTASMTRGEKSISLKIGESAVTVNDHTYQITEAPVIINDKTYVPEDFVFENMGVQVKWNKSGGTVEIKSIAENNITVKTKKIVEKTETLDINIQYPEVQGLESKEIQDEINSIFRKKALNAKEQAHKIEEELKSEDVAQMMSYFICEEYLNYKVKYNSDDKLSIVFQDYSFSGGAHGMTVQTSYTFDLKTGKQYELKDLFKENADYVSLINSEIKKQISERGWDTLLLEPFKTIKPDQDFYLANGSFVIYFQLYDITPYYMGIPEFPVDFSILQSLIKQY